MTPPDPGGERRLLGPPAAPRLDAGDVIASLTLCLTPPRMSEVADADSLGVANALGFISYLIAGLVAWIYIRHNIAGQAAG